MKLIFLVVVVMYILLFILFSVNYLYESKYENFICNNLVGGEVLFVICGCLVNVIDMFVGIVLWFDNK